ncbi:hypothetical protein BOX15_Mlig020675g1, partial [Macrostomum lignano]
LPTAPPPPYRPTEEPDVPLLGKEEPPAASNAPGSQQQQPPPYSDAAGPPAVVVSQPQMVVLHSPLGMDPGTALCPACQQFVPTEVNFETGTLTWLVCASMCLLGLNLGCCFIPFCIDTCKDAVHKCPHCGSVLHRHSRV